MSSFYLKFRKNTESISPRVLKRNNRKKNDTIKMYNIWQ